MDRQDDVDAAIRIPVRSGHISADLTVPARPRALIIFAHGSGSSRHSPRNRAVAQALQQQRFATLLADLLTTDEEAVDRHTGRLRFDIGLLARRLVTLIDWAKTDAPLKALPIGIFGASTGAGAALVAAAARPQDVAAVVSRGGRPDLAGASLDGVTAPTLLLVGSRDVEVIELNRQAQRRMRRSPASLELIQGATHLFEEPGTLELVAARAGEWFVRHLSAAGATRHPAGAPAGYDRPSSARGAARLPTWWEHDES